MSLQVWLPLNGTIENKGLIDWNPTIQTNTTKAFESGKIGQALSTGGIIMPASVTKQILNNDAFSYTCWLYIKGETGSTSQRSMVFGNDTISSLGGRQFSLFNYPTCNDLHWSWQNYTNGTYSNAWGGVLSGVLPSNTWTHIAVTYQKGGRTKIYINGQVKYNNVFSSNADSFEFDTQLIWNSAYHRLNDVRLYNHCLSTKQVKQIYKTLVLHYPLDNNGFGNKNLITNYDTSFLSYPDGTLTIFNNQMNSGTQEIVSNVNGVEKCLHLHSNGGNNRQYSTVSVYTGKTYTVSCDYYSTTTQPYPFKGQLNGGNYTWTSSNAPSYTTPNKWVRLSFKYFNLTSDATLYYFMQCSQGTDCYIKNLKIEQGSIATPWCPNDIGILSNINDNIVYDTSGYENNGQIINTITYSSDTPKYSVSTHIGATNQKIHISNFPTSGFGNSYSFAWWGKRSSNSPMFWGFSNGIRLNGMYIGCLWNTGDSSNNPLYYIGTTTQVTPPSTGVWHHYVMTGNGTKCYVYLDGQLWAEAKTYKSISGDSIYINGWDSGTSYCSSDTDISDFRIYATALTEEDIKQLYQTRALGDRNNNFCSTAKFIEEGYNNEIEYFYDFAKGNYAGTFEQKSDGLHLNGNVWVSHSSPYYIPINPSGKTYKVDIVYSNTAGNQFYIGWERYDANKTSRSNQACIYAVSNKPSVDQNYVKTSGIINLSTDGVNPCAFIKLRILNQWTGSTTGTEGKAIIHSLSLKEYSSSDNFTPVNISKTGIVKSTELIQKVNIDKININRPQQINANNFIQI